MITLELNTSVVNVKAKLRATTEQLLDMSDDWSLWLAFFLETK